VLLVYRVLDASDPLLSIDIYDLCTRCRYEATQEYADTYCFMRGGVCVCVCARACVCVCVCLSLSHTHTDREREARVLDQLSGVVIELSPFLLLIPCLVYYRSRVLEELSGRVMELTSQVSCLVSKAHESPTRMYSMYTCTSFQRE
jgi:hypothetical protein